MQRLLDRHGDELLRLLRGQPDRDRLHLDLRLRELGEDVDRRVAKRARRRSTIIAALAATTRKRNFRLDPTIQRIMAALPPPAQWLSEARLGPEQLGHADRHDRGAARRART